MRIKILGFKCHLDIEFTFINNEMTLIKGGSGLGKSTILQAIYWGLYGNMRSIYNNAGITMNLSVYLELPGMHIHRKKNPELLSVNIVNDTYEDAIAQSVIDNHFGNRELWKACSYIEQKSRCSLLSGSSSERMELLNALSFTGENPKEYISKINENLKEVTQLFTTRQSSFVTEIELYNKSMKERPVTVTLNIDKLTLLKNQIILLEQEEKTYYEEVCNFERQLGTYTYLENRCNILEDKVNSYVSQTVQAEDIVIPEFLYISKTVEEDHNLIISFSDYSNTKNTIIKELSSIQTAISEKDKLSKELFQVEESLNLAQSKILNIPNINDLINIEVKQEQIWNVSKLEKDREMYIKECESLKLEYDEKSIKDVLDSLNNKLNHFRNLEKHIDNYKRLIFLEKEIQSNIVDDNKSLLELEKLSKEKSLLKADLLKAQDLLTCPSCKTPLRYKNRNLTIGERDPVTPEEIALAELECQKFERLLVQVRKLTNLKDNAKILNDSLHEIRNDLREYDSSVINQVNNLISRISNVKYLNKPDLSSVILTDIASFQKYYHLKNNIINSINSISVGDEKDVENMNNKLKEIEEKYKLEQERLAKNQELLREHQRNERDRLEQLNKLEKKKRDILEKTKRIDIENLQNEQDKKDLIVKKEELEKLRNQMDKGVKLRYENVKGELEKNKKKLDEAEYGNKIVERGKELGLKREVLLKLQKDVEALTRLKLKAVEIECKQLEDTVNNINTILETTLPIFFNDPISLRLLLYKKLKNKDTVKPGLNLEICYKGCKYDDIKGLSGGEGDRISLGLLLALNAVSNSPILLLDECVSSLDGDLKESCIEAIKSIPNKTVICVDHDDSLEGFYDAVIMM